MENLFTYYIQVALITFIVINHFFEIYLAQRQVTTLHEHRTCVPDEFSSQISLADHQKAILYASAKLRTSQIRVVWDAVLLFYWFPFRGAEKLYLALDGSGLKKEILFLITFTLIQALLNLPWSIYSTFVLEEKFGFNRNTPKLFITDLLKSVVLGLILGTPLLYGILLFYQNFPNYWWLISFIFVTLFQLALVWLYPSLIAPLFNKFKPLEAQDLKQGIEKLVAQAGFQAKEVFVMDASKRSSHGNAYFTGLGKKKRVVFFDTLLKDLRVDEILAILAHELGHMKFKHIPKSLILSLIMSFIGFWLMGKLATQNWFYSGHFIRVISPGVLLLLFSQVIPIYTFWFTPLQSWISRKREFEADAYAAGETDPEHLISGLLKLYKENANPVVTDKLYSSFYHSHPPALERIGKLRLLKRLAG